MISKKKLSAFVISSLFITPTIAQTSNTVWKNEIYNGSGTLEVEDKDFQSALATDDKGRQGYVKLWVMGTPSNTGNNVSLALSNTEGYSLKTIAFHENGTLNSADHKLSFALKNSSLGLENGLIFRNAAYFIKLESDGSLQSETLENLRTTTTVSLEGSTLTGNIINQYNTYSETSTFLHQVSLNNNTAISLTSSEWTGDLKDEINLGGTALGKPVDKNEAGGEYVVSLKNGSTWTGGVDVAKKSTVEVTLDGTSSWTVTKDSKVNSIQFENVATRRAAQQKGVAIADGVTLTIADGFSDKQSTIGSLQTGSGSSLAVENADVTINSIGGSGMVQLNKNGVVTINAASDKVNATLTSLEGSKLTTADDVNAGVTISGALADEMGMDAVIEAYNAGNNYAGNGTVTFSGGLLGDDIIGRNGESSDFVRESVRKNAQLVSIGESTAITMMQWRADADDMAQRMGDLRNGGGTAGAWVRTFGGKAEAGHVDNKYYGIQAGVDALIGTGGTKQFAGGALSYATGDADFANGTGENYIGTLTGYSTWLFENGAYIDVTAKWGKLHNEFDLAVDTRKLSGRYSTQALALTVESGHRFPLSRLTYVEPQVAFTASHIFGEDYGASEGVTVEQDSINSYVARVGLQAGLNCPNNMGAFFVRASYLYDLDGETSTTARMANAKDANRFDQDFGGGWYELGLGMNVNFTKNLYGYADFEYVTGGEIKTPYRWNAGVRYAF